MDSDNQQLDRALIKATVEETFLLLGIDISDPLENQKDFAYLRFLRESSEKWGIKTKLMLFAATCTFIISVLVWVVKAAFTGEWW